MSRPVPCGRCLSAMLKWTDGPKPVCEDTEMASNKCRRCKDDAKFCVKIKRTGVFASRSIILAHVLASEVEHNDYPVKSAQTLVKNIIRYMKEAAKCARQGRIAAELQRAMAVKTTQLEDILTEFTQIIDAENDDPNEDIIVKFSQIAAAKSTQPEDIISKLKQSVALIEQSTVQHKASIAALSKLYNQVAPLDKEWEEGEGGD